MRKVVDLDAASPVGSRSVCRSVVDEDNAEDEAAEEDEEVGAHAAGHAHAREGCGVLLVVDAAVWAGDGLKSASAEMSRVAACRRSWQRRGEW